MVAVIAIHSTPFDDIDLGGDEAALMLVVRQVASFSVALLLAISGLMAGWSRDSYDRHYIISRLKRLLPPYIIWSLIFIAIYQPGHFTSVALLLVDFFSGQGMLGIGYFVVLLTQMVILTPLIARINTLRVHIMTMAAVTAAGVGYTYYVGQSDLYLLSKFPYTTLPFPVFYPFYHLGFVVAREGLVERLSARRALGTACIAAVLALGLSLAEAFAWLPYRLSMAGNQVKAGSLLYSLAMFAVMVRSRGQIRFALHGWLSWFGRNSYAVYLMHLLPTLGLLQLARASPTPAGGPLVVGGVILGSLVAVSAMVALVRRCVPARLQPVLTG